MDGAHPASPQTLDAAPTSGPGLAAPLPRLGRAARPIPKGRQVDPAALEAVAAVIGTGPHPRDLVIERLHALQDRFGALYHAHLAALADLMRLSQAEVYEVATFYAHFDVVAEDAPAPPPVTLRVCDGLTCEMAGARALIEQLRATAPSDVRVVTAPCMGRCNTAPVVEVGHHHIDHARPHRVLAAAADRDLEPRVAEHIDLGAYRAAGGYRLLQACLDGRHRPEDLIAAMSAAGLRGLGGAGFPAGKKWQFVRAEPGPRLMAVNADEGEPGTFKDRYHFETDPHRVLEGMLIAAWAVEAADIYIYLRDEYPGPYRILRHALDDLARAGLLTGRTVHLRRGAGAYICGEESAMLESLEGRRGLPRHKPPYPSQVGLFGRPTLTHNVETLFWVRDIVERGPDWWAAQGRNGCTGLRSYSVSGRVREPGVKIAPAGVTIRELIDEFCGGMADGHRFKAYLPGGASGGILPACKDDIPLDFGMLEEHNCFIGSAAVIVLSDQDDMRAVALNLMRFFAYESCGQCTPCRLGTEKAVALMERPEWNRPLLAELSQVMRDASICGLGQAAPNPLDSVLKWFPEEVGG